MTWKTRATPPYPIEHARLVMTSGPTVEMWQARVLADSVVGFADRDSSARVSVSSASVKKVQTRGVSGPKTTLLVLVGAFFLLGYGISGTHATASGY